MSDALKTLDSILQGAAAGPQQYAPNSRYYGVPTKTLMRPDGTVISYLARQFVPRPESFAQLRSHTVVQGDRLDNLAATYFGDPVQWWRLADANRAMRPAALTETIGVQLRITLPAGVPLGAGKL
jgi:nucleoid-associated protein YgaU